MASFTGRRFFFATAGDLQPGLSAAQNLAPTEFLLQELRDDRCLKVYQKLSDATDIGCSSSGDVAGSNEYLLFRTGHVPKPKAVPQRRGSAKYGVDPSRDCLILRCGGLHQPTGALVAGELQLPLNPNRHALKMFEIYTSELFRGFYIIGDYWLGPEALHGFRGGQRLVTIGVRSPREYDLSEG